MQCAYLFRRSCAWLITAVWPAIDTALGLALQPFVPLREDDTFAAALAAVTADVRRVPVVSSDGATITNILSQSAILKALLDMQLPEVGSLRAIPHLSVHCATSPLSAGKSNTCMLLTALFGVDIQLDDAGSRTGERCPCPLCRRAGTGGARIQAHA